jgi:hypothetical protein
LTDVKAALIKENNKFREEITDKLIKNEQAMKNEFTSILAKYNKEIMAKIKSTVIEEDSNQPQ